MKKITILAAVGMLWFSYQKIHSSISNEPMVELFDIETPEQRSLYNFYRTAEMFIKSQEALVLKPYKCPGGEWTIGWGHVLTKQERKMYKRGITVEMADELFNEDFERFIQQTQERFPELDDHKQIMITSAIAFNLGHGFANERLGDAIKKGRNIKNYLLKYKFAKGRVLKGLKKRREEELKLWNLSDDEYLASADYYANIVEQKIKQAYRRR